MSNQQQDSVAPVPPPSIPDSSNDGSGNDNVTPPSPPPPVSPPPPTAEPPASSSATEIPASTTPVEGSIHIPALNSSTDETTLSNTDSTNAPSSDAQSISENNGQSKVFTSSDVDNHNSSVVTDSNTATDAKDKVDGSQAETSTTNVEKHNHEEEVVVEDDDDEYDPTSILSDDDLENPKADLPDIPPVASSTDGNTDSTSTAAVTSPTNVEDDAPKDVLQVALSIPFRTHPKFMAMQDSEKVALIADYMNNENDPKFTTLFSDDSSSDTASNPFCKRGDLASPMTPEETEAFAKFTATELEIQNNNGWDNFPPDSRLFIGHLGGLNIDKQLLWKLCKPYGTVYQITLRPNFAFIQYTNREECEAAIKGESNVPLFNRTLILEISKPHPKKDNTSKRGHQDSNINDNNKRGRSDNNNMNSNNSKYKSASNNFPVGTQCFIYVKHAASKKLVVQLVNMLNNGVVRANTMDVAPFVSIKSLINDAAYSGILGTVVVHRDGNMDCYMFENDESNGSGGIQFDEYEGLTLDQVNQLFITAAAKHPENTGSSGNSNSNNNNNNMIMSNHNNMKNNNNNNNNRKKDHGKNFRTRDGQDNPNNQPIGNRGGRSNGNNNRHNNNNRRNNNNNYNNFNNQQHQPQQFGANGMPMNPEVLQSLKSMDAGTLQNFLSLVNQMPGNNNGNYPGYTNNNSNGYNSSSNGNVNGYHNNSFNANSGYGNERSYGNNFNNNGYGNHSNSNNGGGNHLNTNNGGGYGNNNNIYYGNNNNGGYGNNSFEQQRHQQFPGNSNMMMNDNVYGMMNSSVSSNSASAPPPVNKSNESSGSGPSNISNLMQTLKRLQGN